MEILREVAAARGLTVARIVGACQRRETTAARKAFCILAAQHDIRTKDVANILSCDRSTVNYHQSDFAKENKRRTRSALALKARTSHINAWCKLLRAVEMAEH